jgi:hypothetical protein
LSRHVVVSRREAVGDGWYTAVVVGRWRLAGSSEEKDWKGFESRLVGLEVVVPGRAVVEAIQ